MFTKKIPLFALAIIMSVALFGFIKADDDPIKKAAAQLEKWLSDYPQEKAYLHFDKPYYTAGDDMWFKAYITVGPQHRLSALSGALNVELIDDKDFVKQAIKIPLVAGLGNGDFALSDTLAAGSYRIRAYTNWMRNSGPDYFFDKTIQIGNATKNVVLTKTNYTYTSEGGKQIINASANYTDLSGAPYANKEVSYQVQLNNKDVFKGKGITDARGDLPIVFANPLQVAVKQGAITTKIRIGEKVFVTNVLPLRAVSAKVNVQFFPESGNMVNGLPSKIAFKAVGDDGLGKAISGVVIDNDNQEITKITTQHLGMGAFIVIPEAGKTYQAKITYEDGSQNTIALPRALDQGYVMSVNGNLANDPDHVLIRIIASPALATSEINLIAQCGGNVCFAAKNKLVDGAIASKIAKDRFPSGIVQFTLFSATGEAINERLIFVNRADGLKLDVTSAKQTYAPREKVKFDLSTNSPDDKPVQASLSAAVIDETRVPVNESEETTILSSMLLSSDIKGYIEKPNYYIVNNDKQAHDDLDLLMLTQGYRRFEWKQLMSDNFTPPVYESEKTLQVSGRVHTSNNKPVEGGKVTLFTTAGGIFILDTLTDANGRFVFKDLTFKDSIRFVVQARTAKDKKYVDIDLDNVGRQKVTTNVNAPDIDLNNTSMLTYLQSSKLFYQQQIKYGVGNHNIMLKEVVITEKKKPVLENSANLNGPGNADQVIKSDVFENLGCSDITVCLQGRLLGVTFRAGIAYSTRSFSNPMQIIVDGVYVEPQYLAMMNPYDVGSIEVLRSGATTAIYGTRGAFGVIIVNTKRGNEVSDNQYQRYTPGLIRYSPKGYYKARAFYSPQYDDPKTNAALADLRSTIYWNPSVITDKDGKATIEFFNAGSKGTYRVVVEGIDNDGHIGRHVYRYKVE
jgi:TonB-dependent SusC/RagA subfamily outer membrane receptor